MTHWWCGPGGRASSAESFCSFLGHANPLSVHTQLSSLAEPRFSQAPAQCQHPETKNNIGEREDVWKPVSKGGPRASCHHSLEGSLPTWNRAGTQLGLTSWMQWTWSCANSHPQFLIKASIFTFPSLKKILGDLSHGEKSGSPAPLERSQAVTTLRGEAPRPYGEGERGSRVPAS